MISAAKFQGHAIPDAAPDMERIMSEYGDSLYRMAFLYLKDAHLAEDAVQETFIKVYRSYNTFRGDSSEKTWMMRIAINICKDMLKQPWRKHVDETAVLDEIAVVSIPDSTDYNGLMIEIMKLPPKYKEIVLLHYYQDIKTSEIAAMFEIPLGTVLVRLKRARAMLEKNLKGWYDNAEA